MTARKGLIAILIIGVIVLAVAAAPRFANMAAASAPAAAPPISNDIVISARDNEQYETAIAYNWKHNEYLVVWQDQVAGVGIYGQRVTSRGQLVGPSPITIAEGPKPRREPDVAYDPVNDRYLVVWMHDISGSGDWDISGRFIPWENSTPSLPEFSITGWAGAEWHPEVAYARGQTPKQEFLVVCVHHTSVPYIAGVRVYADGSGTVNVGAISTGSETRDQPDLTYNLARNEYLLTWNIGRGGQWDVDGVILDGNANPLGGGAFGIANSGSDELYAAASACDTADQYLVVWQTVNWLGDDEIRGRYVDGNGTPGAFDFQLDTTKGDEGLADVACNSAEKQYLVVWQEKEQYVNSKYGILGTRIDTFGNFMDVPAFEIVSPSLSPADRVNPAVASGPQPSYLVAWEHTRQGTSYIDIHGKLIGNTAPLAAFTITPASGDTSTLFHFDASGCTDGQDATADLEVCWDWDNDGNCDEPWSKTKTFDRKWSAPNTYTVRLQVRDSGGLTHSTTRQVTVNPPSVIVRYYTHLPMVLRNR